MEIKFDTNIPYTDEDKERIRKNIQILQEKNLLYMENMKFIPTKANTELMEPSKLVNHLLSVYFIALKAKAYINGENAESWKKISAMMNKYYNFDKIEIEEKYMNMLKLLSSTEISGEEIIQYSWLYEECAIDLWALKLIDFPDQTKETDGAIIDKIILGLDEKQIFTTPKLYNTIYDDNMNPVPIEMRSYEEILEKADLLVRYKWAFDEAKTKGTNLDTDISQLLVETQLEGFCNLLNYDSDISIDGEEIEIDSKTIAESFGRRPTKEYDTETYKKKETVRTNNSKNILYLILTILILFLLFAICIVYF